MAADVQLPIAMQVLFCLYIAPQVSCSAMKVLLQAQATTHLAIAKKCHPGFSERFNLFVKQREHRQASESDNSGEGAKDLVSIVSSR